MYNILAFHSLWTSKMRLLLLTTLLKWTLSSTPCIEDVPRIELNSILRTHPYLNTLLSLGRSWLLLITVMTTKRLSQSHHTYESNGSREKSTTMLSLE